MRHRINNYTINGQNIVLEENITIEDVRLIVNETQNIVICSSMQKAKVTVSDNKINVPITVCTLSSNDKLTIEIDKGTDLKHINNELNNIKNEVNKLTALDSDIKLGKEVLALAITAKGVHTDIDDSLVNMAKNIGHITQKSYIIDGDSIKDNQNYANGTLYDLYKELYKIKNDNRIQNKYKGIVLCQFFHSYDSFDLSLFNADAYLTCDGDFYDYRSTHIWHDENTGKADRWVAFLFQDGDNATFIVPSKEQCPRKVFIGGHMNQFICSVEGCISEIVVPDELDENGVQMNVLDSINFNSTHVWQQNVVIKNINKTNNTDSAVIKENSTVTNVLCDIEEFDGGLCSNLTNLNSLILPKLKTMHYPLLGSFGKYDVNINMNANYPNLSIIIVPKGFMCDVNKGSIEYTTSNCFIGANDVLKFADTLTIYGLTKCTGSLLASSHNEIGTCVKKLIVPDLEIVQNAVFAIGYYPDVQICEFIAPKLKRLGNFIIGGYVKPTNGSNLIKIELGPVETNINLQDCYFTEALREDSESLIYKEESFNNNREKWLYNFEHFIANKVSDRTGLSALTLTLAPDVKSVILAQDPEGSDGSDEHPFGPIHQILYNKNWNIA